MPHRHVRRTFAGLKALTVRYGAALSICFAIWWLLHVLRPCEPSSIGPPECSVLERTVALERLYGSDWLILALLSLGITLLWTVLSWAFRLWRFLEIAMRERGLRPLLGGAAICSIAFAMSVVVHQLAFGIRPCFDRLVARPMGLLGCYIFFSDELPVWPSNDSGTYVGLAILAAVIVGARFAFRSWRRS